MNVTKKSPNFCLQPVSAACLMLVMLTATNLSAAPLNLAQVPVGNGSSEPAPNVIISVDNSGSMAQNDAGGNSTSATNPSKMTSLKAALTAQFVTLDAAGNPKVPNNRIRLAWQSMWVNSGGVAGSDSLTLGAVNSMKRLNDGHRANFSAFVTNLTAANGTPSHKMMKNAYEYMKSPAGTDSPWADNPGTAQSTDYLACRRTYHVFMTDGAWNTQGSDNTYAARKTDGTNGGDGASRTLPSPHVSLNLTPSPPTQYDPASAQVKVYKDQWGNDVTKASTLSDFAFRSWAEDLQPTMDNKVKPLIKQSGIENVTASNGSVTPLEEFWNPKNDPATWQHIKQHTIGFGSGATNWGANVAPLWSATNDNYGGDYPNLVNGTVVWPSPAVTDTSNTPDIRTSELWHAALNGRGKFYPALNANALSAAFGDILDNILADTTKPLSSIAVNGASLNSNSKSYVAGYDAVNWSGRLKALPIDATTGATGANEIWSATGLGAINASNQFVVNDPGKLDDPNYVVGNRLVMSYNGASAIEWRNFPTATPVTDPFWLPLSKNSSGTADANGQNRLNYIRGDRTKEQSQTGGIFRNRGSRLGDIVNSKILYLGKPVSNYGDAAYQTFKRPIGSGSRANMLYVGANDGMLHGFDAATGVEKLAYIPQGIAQGNLRKLTDPNYTHQYFVDGTPFAGDAKVGTSTPDNNPWKTVLVSGLGGGGKGYVALNVTNPANFSVGNVPNLVSADSLVIADTTASTDADMGNMFITPAIDPQDASRSSQIVRVNASNAVKHRWALVVGNGYNSTHEAPVLIVQYLDGANDAVTGQKEIKKISPCISVSSASAGVFDNACAYKTNTGLTSNGLSSNGLSTPRLVDLNDDGIVDVAYAGDLLGNVWKFDLSSQNPAEWKTSFTNEPLFKAKSGQSFTTAPYVDSNFTAGSGVQIHISSGKNLTAVDQTSTGTETTYSLWDNSRFGPVVVNPNATPLVYKFTISDLSATRINTSNVIPNTLVEQTIALTPFTDSGNDYYTSSSNPVDYGRTSAPDRGWYMDWKKPGQRVLRNSKSFDGQKISVYSTVPSSATVPSNVESCTPGVNSEKNFLTILNMFTGHPSKARTFEFPDTVAAAHPGATTVELPPGDFVEVKTRNANGQPGGKVVSACPEGQVCKPPIATPWGSYVGAKAGWREKQ
jgi:type IV pilus assembly protein PilY1